MNLVLQNSFLKLKQKVFFIYNALFFIIDASFLFFKIKYRKNIFIFPFYHTGGAEKVHLDIVKSFPPQDNLVIFTNNPYNTHFLFEFEKHAKVFHYHRYRHNLYFRKIILKILSQIKNSSKITVLGCNSSYFYDILEFLPKNVKKIDLLHAFTFPDPGGAEIYSLSKVHLLDKRIVINQKTKNDYINLYQEKGISKAFIDRINIINIAVEIPNIKPLKNHKKEKLQIVYCGRIAKEKRVNLVVEIANKIEKYADVKIYGHKEIEVMGIDQYYQKNIIDSNELKKIYEEADVLMITSYREGFPVVIKEAMANGVVCISTDVGSIHEHVINNQTGYIIPNENENFIINNFIEIIETLSLNRNLLNTLSNNTYAHAVKNFNLKQFQEKISHLFSE